jgi:hypothetical protein
LSQIYFKAEAVRFERFEEVEERFEEVDRDSRYNYLLSLLWVQSLVVCDCLNRIKIDREGHHIPLIGAKIAYKNLSGNGVFYTASS